MCVSEWVRGRERELRAAVRRFVLAPHVLNVLRSLWCLYIYKFRLLLSCTVYMQRRMDVCASLWRFLECVVEYLDVSLSIWTCRF